MNPKNGSRGSLRRIGFIGFLWLTLFAKRLLFPEQQGFHPGSYLTAAAYLLFLAGPQFVLLRFAARRSAVWLRRRGFGAAAVFLFGGLLSFVGALALLLLNGLLLRREHPALVMVAITAFPLAILGGIFGLAAAESDAA